MIAIRARRIAAVIAAFVLALTLAGPVSPAQALETRYYKYAWSDTVWGHTVGSNTSYTMSYARWVAAGSPQPQTVYRIPGDVTVRNASNPDELFVRTPNVAVAYHHLTYAEWLNRGADTVINTGIQYRQHRLMDLIDKKVPGSTSWVGITYAEWVKVGKPTPVIYG